MNVEDLEVVPVIDNKPLSQNELVGDALAVISHKEFSDDADPDLVAKRNSYRDLHRPDISSLEWVNQSSSKEEVRLYRGRKKSLVSVLIQIVSNFSFALADRNARCVIGYWHDTVVCPSVCLSVMLCIVANDTSRTCEYTFRNTIFSSNFPPREQ